MIRSFFTASAWLVLTAATNAGTVASTISIDGFCDVYPVTVQDNKLAAAQETDERPPRKMLTSRRFDGHRIIDIALACGFADISYFNRAFRARYGVTPSDVRNGAFVEPRSV